MNNDILKKSFYLTSLFADIKSEHTWSTNETKLILLLFSELNKYKVYLPDFDYFKGTIDDYKNIIKDIPTDFIFKKDDFQKLTLVRKEHLSREINKVRKSLGSKVINTPHPIEAEDSLSGRTIPWFSEITYSSKKGEIFISLNNKAIERLVAFVKYSNIGFDNIVKIQNHNAIYTYLILKILKDASRQNYVLITIDEFKEKLGMIDKYRSFSTFKTQVLEIVEKEINKFTDMNLSYELIKEGRSFTKIKFIFDYKPEYLEQKAKSKSKQHKAPQIVENTANDDYGSPFEHILTGWNIRARKVVELEETYSLEVIQQAIDLTLEKEKAGEIKTTKAAIFLGILENKQLASDEQFERAKNELEQQQDKKLREKISAEYDKLSSFILSNQDIIQSALASTTKHLPIADKDAIPVFKKLKSIDADKFRAYTVPILNFYHFESNSKVSSTLSDIIDRSQYIEIERYKNDMAIVQAYKKALDKIKEDEYITDEQKDILIKEVHETINILLGL